MKDPGEPSAPTEADTGSAAPAAAETPASKKGASNGGSSKKKAAVPEHKSKKLNKKKSRPMTNLEGEYILLTRFNSQHVKNVILTRISEQLSQANTTSRG